MDRITLPVVRRVGDRIVAIRFKVTWEKPWHQYQEIVEQLPKDLATRLWKAGRQDMRIVDGIATVLSNR